MLSLTKRIRYIQILHAFRVKLFWGAADIDI